MVHIQTKMRQKKLLHRGRNSHQRIQALERAIIRVTITVRQGIGSSEHA